MTKTVYQMPDGKFIRASNYKELVRRMRNSSYAYGNNTEEWMQNFSDRVVRLTEIDIRTDTVDHFVEDLLSFDIIRVVSTD